MVVLAVLEGAAVLVCVEAAEMRNAAGCPPYLASCPQTSPFPWQTGNFPCLRKRKPGKSRRGSLLPLSLPHGLLLPFHGPSVTSGVSGF